MKLHVKQGRTSRRHWSLPSPFLQRLRVQIMDEQLKNKSLSQTPSNFYFCLSLFLSISPHRSSSNFCKVPSQVYFNSLYDYELRKHKYEKEDPCWQTPMPTKCTTIICMHTPNGQIAMLSLLSKRDLDLALIASWGERNYYMTIIYVLNWIWTIKMAGLARVPHRFHQIY